LSGRCARSLYWETSGKQEGCKDYANEETNCFHRSFLSVGRQVDADAFILPDGNFLTFL
jgi:hypothetical protein